MVSCKCEVCGLEFSGQVVLETHLAGAKHAKKVKSQEILRQLQNSGQTFSRDEKTKILKCEVCDVVVNSSQQLQTHLAGNKHKQKVLKKTAQSGAGQLKSAPSSGMVPTTNAVGGPHLHGLPDNKGDAERAVTTGGCGGGGGSGGGGGGGGGADGDGAPPAKKMGSDVVGGGGLPTPVPAPGPAPASAPTPAQRTSKYFCDTCGVSLNSEIQLEQHLGSRKHKDRMANGGKSRPRPAPYWKKPRGPGFGSGGGGGGINNKQVGVGAGGGKLPGPSLPYTQPLSSTFVSGGSMM